MASNIPVIVQGNSFNLAIPLQIYVINGDQMELQDYTPDPTDQISIQLKGSRRNYTYTPTSVSDNVCMIVLGGYELADNYSVVVSIVKADGQRLRSFRTDQFFIVESSDNLTQDDIIEGLEENVIYLNSSIFVAGADGRGITSIIKTSTAGLVDTYTITYTDETTSTFNVTNGAPGADGQQGEDGVGITSIEKTATAGLVDTYTITLSNGNTSTFDVTNGKDGVDLGLAEIVNDLTTGGATNVLSAEMGKTLGDEVDTLKGITKYSNNSEDASNKYIYKNGSIWDSNGWSVSREIALLAGETINVTVPSIKENSIVIGRVKNSSSVYTADAILATTGQTNYSYTATADCAVKITYKTSEGFSAYVDKGNPTAKVDAKVETILSRLGGTVIPFDQPKTYTFVNGSLVENAGSLTTDCSTSKINIADYKVLLCSCYRNTYNGFFCAFFLDDEDNFMGFGLTSYATKRATPEVQTVVCDMVDVLQEVPEGATKVVIQTSKEITAYKHLVIGFSDFPYNFLHDANWRQDYYGVVGDGTTDDSAALQKLLNNSRGEVTLRAGTYLIESSLYVNATKLRKINGNGATIKVKGDITALDIHGNCTDDASPAIQGQWNVDHAGFVLENLNITSDDDTEGLGVKLTECLKPIIKSCYIFHIKDGISMARNRDVIIEGNNIYQCSGNGILFAQGSSVHQCNISANHISWCKDCITMDDARQINNIQITGNDIEVGSSYPTNSDNCCIRIKDETSIIFGQIEIVGNTIQGHQGSSKIISITGYSTADSKTIHGVMIIGNFMSGCAGNLIELSHVKNIAISANTVTIISNSFINISKNASKIAISGNSLDGVFKLLTTEEDAVLSYINVNGNVGNNASVTVDGTSQDYISVVGNNLGGGAVTIGTATHKQEANNL